MKEVLKAYRAIVTEGLLPESEVDARVKRELAIKQRQREANGEVKGAGAGTQLNGSAYDGSTLTYDKLLKMPQSELAKIDERLVAEIIDKAGV
jgi:hypothetical protein